MSIECMTRVWNHSRHSGTKLLALLALADHANSDGVCWPGIPRIAQRARTIPRHATRIINSLAQSGEVYVDVGGGRGKSNLYLVCVGLGDIEILGALMNRDWFDLTSIEAQGALATIRQRQAAFAPPGKGNNPVPQVSVSDNPDVGAQNPAGQVRNADFQGLNPALTARNPDLAVSGEPPGTDYESPGGPSESGGDAQKSKTPTADSIWHTVLCDLQLEMPKATFDTWVKPSFAIGYQNGSGPPRLRVAVENRRGLEILESRLRPMIERAVSRVAGQPAQIDFVLATAEDRRRRDDHE